MPQVPVSESAAKVQFTKRGQPPAFYVLAESGFDRRPQTTEVRQGSRFCATSSMTRGTCSRA
jgi:hypothetical protein